MGTAKNGFLEVRCKFLVPGSKSTIQRPHCDMGDGREGDCPIYLGKSDKCKFRKDE